MSVADTNDLQPGFIVIHGNQSETLRDLLRDWMRAYPLGPLENEVILVQSNGIAQWLSLSLAADPEPDGGGGLGIAAALDIQLPSRFIWQAYRDVLGDDQVPDQAPFGRELLIWRLMRLLPQWLDEPDFEPLRRFLTDDPLLRRRHQLAEQLADLFDQYQVYRADWLQDWAEGRDVIRTQRRGIEPLAADTRWQARLWRALLADAGEAAATSNRAVIHQRFMEACADQGRQRPPALPARVLVFGISALPRQALDVLSALGRWCQILMCVQNPSRYYWADLIPERDLLAAAHFRHPHRPGHEALHLRVPGLDHGHALLAAWGRQGRDFIGLLAEHDEHAQAESRLLQISRRADVFIDPVSGTGQGTMLLQLQQDILDLAPLIETRTRWPAVDPQQDRSIRFHICHSPQREVEVLHDQLLAAFEEDPGLQPRDVMVMVPDIDTYAPHVQAVFGLHGPDSPRFIPFTVADQASRRHEPLLAAVEFLLGLPQARLSVSEVLDLLDVQAVQRRFGVAPGQLRQLRHWIASSGIRWGLDPSQREALDITGSVEQNSWVFGLKRMLLGYAVGGEGAWAGIEPLDEISGLDAVLLGNLIALVDALGESWTALRESVGPDQWAERLGGMLARFFDPGDEHEAMLLLRLNESLQQWREDCEQTDMNLPLPLSVVREHWLARIEDSGLSKRFFAGAVTFATLMPMRAIPFRQVHLLGMNDRDYPRSRQPADFDLMARDYRPGDRSRREDDRYLFLEALLSARERLSISWVGRSIHDDAPRPPSVLVAQLRDHLAAGWHLASPDDTASAPDSVAGGHAAGQTDLLAALTTQHRLQPFSRSYFETAGRAQGLFSYAEEWRRALLGGEAAGDHPGLSPGLGWPKLDPMPWPDALGLVELGRFLRNPVRQFFLSRLDILLEQEDEALQDQESFSLDGLTHWKLQAELIEAQRHALDTGQSREQALAAGVAHFAGAGLLPVGGFGEMSRQQLTEPMQKLFDDYAALVDEYPRRLPDQAFDWPADEAGRLPAVSGRIDQLREAPDGRRVRLVLTPRKLIDNRRDGEASSGKASGKPGRYRHDQLVADWVVHLAMQVSGLSVPSRLIGTNGQVPLRALSPREAQDAWRQLLVAWREGMRYPLPLAIRTAFDWLMEAGIRLSPEERERWCQSAGADLPSGPDWQALVQDQQKLAEKLRNRYEGDADQRGSRGERDQNPYLSRAYPDMAALWDEGAFAAWAMALLLPLREAIEADPDDGGAGSASETGGRTTDKASA